MSVKTQRQMLETAIAADFDDVAAHAAYADLLVEEGDPRGEFIQLHLALEDKNQSPRLRANWGERASRLRQQHEPEWLGSLARFLLNRPSRGAVEPVAPNIEFTYRRGWLAELHVQDVRDAFTTVLAQAPEARMLQALTLRNTRLPNNQGPLEPLLSSPNLATAKTFALGDPEAWAPTADGNRAAELVARTPQLQGLELRAAGVDAEGLFRLPLPCLRSLFVDYLAAAPLRVLADNRSLARVERVFLHVRPAGAVGVPGTAQDDQSNEIDFELVLEAPEDWGSEHLRPFLTAPQFDRLTDLTLRYSQLGDAGCQEIARSGVLRRLKRLDLRNCEITDAGASGLADSPDLRRLDWLDVGGNRLTMIGVNRLEETGIRVQWDSQWGEYPDPPLGEDVIV